MACLERFVVVVTVPKLAPTVHQGGSTRAHANIEAAHLAAKIAESYGVRVATRKNQNGTFRVQTPMGIATIQVGRNMHGRS